MTFDEATEYLNSLNKFGSVLSLDNMRVLLDELDNPQKNLKIIHVTGTNGKGSTCAYLSSILKEAELKTGTYNSPAVICEYDQYKIDCEIISKKQFADSISAVKACADKLNKKGIFPTRFETETAAAFILFEKEKTDTAVIETGLGGTDDATCVIDNAIMHIITKISGDHIPILGNNVKEIAENKSGIIKTSAPTVVYKSDLEALEAIKRKCEKMRSPLYELDPDEYSGGYLSGLHNLPLPHGKQIPEYLYFNSLLAAKSADVLKTLGYNISAENISDGIKNAYIPFRFEKISDSPVIIADGAHNPDGAMSLMECIKSVYNKNKYIFVAGIFKDKDYENICRITGNTAEKVIAVQNDLSERSLDVKILSDTLKKYNTNVKVCGTIEEGVEDAIASACKNDDTIIILFGSLSWLNRAKNYIQRRNAYGNCRDGI